MKLKLSFLVVLSLVAFVFGQAPQPKPNNLNVGASSYPDRKPPTPLANPGKTQKGSESKLIDATAESSVRVSRGGHGGGGGGHGGGGYGGGGCGICVCGGSYKGYSGGHGGGYGK